MRNGQLLVITRAEHVRTGQDESLSPWELRANVIESFYDPTKTW